MFAYLSRKIAVPGRRRHRLHCCDMTFVSSSSSSSSSSNSSSSRNGGLIVCGGDEGLLRVISIHDHHDHQYHHHHHDDTTSTTRKRCRNTIANANANYSSHSLPGHSGRVIKVSYNPTHRKIVSADENGLIIVWSFSPTNSSGDVGDDGGGEWREDMIHTSLSSSSSSSRTTEQEEDSRRRRHANVNVNVNVNDLKWSRDGSKVCILYDDGRIMVGSVSGDKLWDTKDMTIASSTRTRTRTRTRSSAFPAASGVGVGAGAGAGSARFQFLAWAPDGKSILLLVVTPGNNHQYVQLYDANRGVLMREFFFRSSSSSSRIGSSDHGSGNDEDGGGDGSMSAAADEERNATSTIVDLQWEEWKSSFVSGFGVHAHAHVHHHSMIAIAYSSGRVEIRNSLFDDDDDDDDDGTDDDNDNDGGDDEDDNLGSSSSSSLSKPLITIHCDMDIQSCKWGHYDDDDDDDEEEEEENRLLAICGLDRTTRTSVVKFYSITITTTATATASNNHSDRGCRYRCRCRCTSRFMHCLQIPSPPTEIISYVMFDNRRLVAMSDAGGVYIANICLPMKCAGAMGDHHLVYKHYNQRCDDDQNQNQIVFQDLKRGLQFHTNLEGEGGEGIGRGRGRGRRMKIVSIQGSKHFCLVIAKAIDASATATPATATTRHQLHLFDNAGGCVATKTSLHVEPLHVAIGEDIGGGGESCIAIADDEKVYAWIIGSYIPTIASSSSSSSENSCWTHSLQDCGIERMFHSSDDSKYPAKSLTEFQHMTRTHKGRGVALGGKKKARSSFDSRSIRAMDVSSKLLIIAMEECIDILSIPNLMRMNRVGLHSFSSIPKAIAINCDSTMFSIIDENHGFRVFEITSNDYSNTNGNGDKEGNGMVGTVPIPVPVHAHVHSHVECIFQEDSKMAWSMKWASDEPTSCALMEKARVSIFERTTQQGYNDHGYGYHHHALGRKYQVGFASSPGGRLMDFSGDQVRVVLFEELLGYSQLHEPQEEMYRTKEGFVVPIEVFDTQHLKIARTCRLSAHDEISYVFESQHPGVLKVLAIRSMEESTSDWKLANRCFVALKDFEGMQFIDRMNGIQDEKLKQSEIAKFVSRRRLDMTDSVRAKYDCKQDTVPWMELKEQKEMNISLLVRDDELLQGSLDAMTHNPDGRAYVEKLGKVSLDMGMISQAARCYSKLGLQERAIEICIANDKWSDAIYHAHTFGKDKVNEIQEKAMLRAQQFILKGKDSIMAGYIFNGASLHSEASKLWYDMGVNMMTEDPALAKTLFVLAGREVVNHKNAMMKIVDEAANEKNKTSTRNTTRAERFEQLMNDERRINDKAEIVEVKLAAFSNAWKEAAKLHFLLLAHYQFYESDYESSMKTVMKCVECVTKDTSKQIYSLLALSSYRAGYLGTFSEALRRLQAANEDDDNDTNDETLERLQKLSIAIFKSQAPRNGKELPFSYAQCLETGKGNEACTISGRFIADEKTIRCHVCGHSMIARLARDAHHCPLCHEPIMHHSSLHG